MKVFVVGNGFGFPNGFGATARVHAYAKGLSENGVKVRVICLVPTEPKDSVQNLDSQGTYDGISFEYSCGQTIMPNSLIQRLSLALISLLRIWELAKESPNAIIIYSNSALWLFFLVLFFKLRGAKCILEKSEFPFVYDKKTFLRRAYAWLFVRTIYKLFDGVIVISVYLENYFRTKIRRSARVLRIPILVNVSEFEGFESEPREGDNHRIVYMGDLGHQGEVASLLQAFSMIAPEHLDCDLQILGGTKRQDVILELKELSRKLKIEDQILFSGAVRRSDLPQYLTQADILVLLRSQGIFSQAGLPTKLGEYLATGKPVIVTSVGDIPLYLQHKHSAYLVPPGDIEAFANTLDLVLSDLDRALVVGRQGKEAASTNFDYLSNCALIKRFIEDL